MDRIPVVLLLVILPAMVTCAAVEGGPFPLEPTAEPKPEDAPEASIEYGVVVDAGSTSSKARVYSWPKQTDRYTVPKITEVCTISTAQKNDYPAGNYHASHF